MNSAPATVRFAFSGASISKLPTVKSRASWDRMAREKALCCERCRGKYLRRVAAFDSVGKTLLDLSPGKLCRVALRMFLKDDACSAE